MSRSRMLASAFTAVLALSQAALSQTRTTSYIQPSVVIAADRVMNMRLPSGHLVSGRVTDGSGTPIAGAHVIAKSDAGYVEAAALCDASGSFTVPLRSADYSIIAFPPAESPDAARLVSTTRRDVAVSADLSLGDLILGTGYLVSGSLTGPSGATSFLRLSLIAIPADSDGQPTVAITGEDMAKSVPYSLVVPAGKYLLTATNAYGYTSTWQPSTVSAFGAAKLAISRDMTRNITLAKGYQLSGTITDTSGRPLSGTLYVQASGSNPKKDGKSAAIAVMAGNYLVHLPAGSFTGVFTPIMDPTAYSGRATRTSFDVTVSSSGRKMDLVAQDGVVLSGKITDPSNKPVPDAWIEIRMPVEGVLAGPDDIPIVAKSDSKGRYRVSVPTGTFDIHAMPPLPAEPTSESSRSERVGMR